MRALCLALVLTLAGCPKPLPAPPATRASAKAEAAPNENRLRDESSPYLLQHADNPVHWFPWGDEAFARAKALNRPVLLSVGYSTCHWCHVMAEESFEDPEIAAYLNDNYVAIKVDREERPDVDAVYMEAVRLLTRGGGWPMTVWLTPDRAPFMGGTYFPPRDGVRGQRKGFLPLLREMKAAYDQDPANIASRAENLAARVRAQLSAPRPLVTERDGALDAAAVLDSAFAFYGSRFDPEHGGVTAPRKFPSSLPVRALLRQHRRTGDARALHMATRTLDQMAAGGIHDHLGGGFHRYTVDEKWRVPHFEKMLYDNALLAVAYLEAAQVTGSSAYLDVARDTLDFMSRVLTDPAGGLYSATDAGGKHDEGLYFTWTPAELNAVLSKADAALVRRVYGVTAAGNFNGRNVLRRAGEPADDGERARLADAENKLLAARLRRPAPFRDEKILAAWNGLAISAFAISARLTGSEDHRQRAERAAAFVLDQLRDADGRLRRSWREGKRQELAFLDDYAFVCAGLLDLFELTGEGRWLDEALALDHVLQRDYEAEDGGYFRTPRDHDAVLIREKPADDGAVPSGNSVHARTLLRLAALTADDEFRVRGERVLTAFGQILQARPAQLSEMLLALDQHLERERQVVIVAPPGGAGLDALLVAARGVFAPNAVFVPPSPNPPALQVLEAKVPLRGTATAYVCEQMVCRLPVTKPDAFVAQLAPTRYEP